MTDTTKTSSRLGKTLAFPLALSLIASLSLVDVCAASVTSQNNAGIKKATVIKTGVKRVASKYKNVVKKATAHPAAVMDPTLDPSPAIAQADMVLKTSLAIAADLSEPHPAQQAELPVAPSVNPYLVNQQQMAPAAHSTGVRSGFSSFKASLPQIPLFEQAILPKIQTVYPTGEKPLVVLTFKCPTELVGIDTPSTLILHKAVNGGMDLINRSNLLAFNMQQVCQ